MLVQVFCRLGKELGQRKQVQVRHKLVHHKQVQV
jgi:hypothetical protein